MTLVVRGFCNRVHGVSARRRHGEQSQEYNEKLVPILVKCEKKEKKK